MCAGAHRPAIELAVGDGLVIDDERQLLRTFARQPAVSAQEVEAHDVRVLTACPRCRAARCSSWCRRDHRSSTRAWRPALDWVIRCATDARLRPTGPCRE